MTKWEYKLEALADGERDGDDYVPYLNQMGAQGWELCGVIYGHGRDGGHLSLHWKRPLPERVELEPGGPSVEFDHESPVPLQRDSQ